MIDYDILKLYVNDIDIYEYYFGDFQLECKYHSPLRDDPRPSFHIRCNAKDKLTWKDFGLYDQVGNDAIAFVQQLFGVDREDAIIQIWNDLVLNKKSSFKKRTIKKPPKKVHDYVGRTLVDYEKEFWNKICIDRKLLSFYNVWGLEQWTINDDVICKSEKGNPAFVYVLTDDAFKIYRPLDSNKRNKFRGINNWNVMEGWDQLPERGQHLFIQSSLKDTMTFRSCGYLSCNSSTENNIDILISKQYEINNRFENVFILFDPDNTGRKKAGMLHRATGWTPMFMPTIWGFKDPSDCVKFCGNHLGINEFISTLDIPIHKYHI